MATVEEVARMSLAAVDTTANFLLACQWVNERYHDLCARVRFRHLRKLGRLTIPAVYSTGTVAITRGSVDVTGTSTAWTNELEGRYFRVHTVWYKVLKVQSATAIVLDQEYTEPDATAASYHIVARQVSLGPRVKWFSDTMVHVRMRRPLDHLGMGELDFIDPERLLVGPPPDRWAQTEDLIDAEGRNVQACEFYPYPTQAETIAFVFWEEPKQLGRQDHIPNSVDDYQLKEGVLIDIMRHNASKAANAVPAQIEAAAYWRNEYRAQETIWQKVTLEVGRQQKGVDDLTLILSMTRSPSGSYYDIQTARDEVYSRGNRP